MDIITPFSQRVGIAVPDDEADDARRILERREHKRAPGVQQASQMFIGMTIVSAVVGGLSLPVWFFLFGQGWGAALFVSGIAFSLTFVVLAFKSQDKPLMDKFMITVLIAMIVLPISLAMLGLDVELSQPLVGVLFVVFAVRFIQRRRAETHEPDDDENDGADNSVGQGDGQ